jgi:hypothetical protein
MESIVRTRYIASVQRNSLERNDCVAYRCCRMGRGQAGAIGGSFTAPCHKRQTSTFPRPCRRAALRRCWFHGRASRPVLSRRPLQIERGYFQSGLLTCSAICRALHFFDRGKIHFPCSKYGFSTTVYSPA